MRIKGANTIHQEKVIILKILNTMKITPIIQSVNKTGDELNTTTPINKTNFFI